VPPKRKEKPYGTALPLQNPAANRNCIGARRNVISTKEAKERTGSMEIIRAGTAYANLAAPRSFHERHPMHFGLAVIEKTPGYGGKSKIAVVDLDACEPKRFDAILDQAVVPGAQRVGR
jgi:hypothetical protein